MLGGTNPGDPTCVGSAGGLRRKSDTFPRRRSQSRGDLRALHGLVAGRRRRRPGGDARPVPLQSSSLEGRSRTLRNNRKRVLEVKFSRLRKYTPAQRGAIAIQLQQQFYLESADD